MKATSFLVNLSYIFGYVEFLILMPTTINPVGFKILFKYQHINFHIIEKKYTITVASPGTWSRGSNF
jgi:hypothetical protein